MTYTFVVYSNLKAIKNDMVFAPTRGKKATYIFVGILGILVIPAVLLSTVFLSLDSAKEKARDARREADIRRIQSGLEIYYTEYGNYPSSLNELSPQYLPEVPVDPKTSAPYQYQKQGESDYQVCAQLELREQKCLSQF
jgi:hypothetical protein